MKNNAFFKIIGTVIAMPFLASGCSAMVLAQYAEPTILATEPAFVIGFETIKVPAGRILLFRTKNEFCALKIENSGTTSVKDKRINYTDYQLSRVVGNGLVHTETGRFALEGMFGLGHWKWYVGNTLIKCGGYRIAWYFPNEFSISGKVGLAVAPTAWTSFSQVKYDDTRVQWFEADPTTKRKAITFPVNSLPGIE